MNAKEIKIGQELYEKGIGWGVKTKCFEIIIKEGKRYVHTDGGVIRKEEDVLNNTCDIYCDKNEINKKLASGYMSKIIE